MALSRVRLFQPRDGEGTRLLPQVTPGPPLVSNGTPYPGTPHPPALGSSVLALPHP